MKQIFPGFHILAIGAVNAFLIETDDELILIDTGYPKSGKKILNYIQKIGRTPTEIKHILITHLHTDHTGSIHEILEHCNPKIYAHPLDAELMAQGKSFRSKVELSPGLIHRIVYTLFVKYNAKTIPVCKVDHPLEHDAFLDLGKGFKIIHIPGHSAGQVALLYQDYGGVMIAADAYSNINGFMLTPFYEDFQQGIKDLKTLSEYNYEGIVCGAWEADQDRGC